MATASVTVPSTGLTADSAQHGNLGRAADYAGDCYCNPLTDPYALRDCYYALSRLLLPPVASRWPLDFWQCRGDSPPIAHLAGTGTRSTGMMH